MTAAGLAIWQVLCSRGRGRARLLVHLYHARELVPQAWVIAMRRTFPRGSDDEAARDYLKTITRHDVEVADLIALAFTSRGWHVRRSTQKHILTILSDLVQKRFATKEESGELVRASELRTNRGRRKQGRRPLASSLSAYRGAEAPRSLVGRILAAQADFNQELVRTLPAITAAAAAGYVVDRAAEEAIRKRISDPSSAAALNAFAARVASTSRDPRLDKLLAADVARSLLWSDPVADVAEDLMAHAKVVIFIQAVDDVGLYQWEIADIIVDAETAAEQAGLHPEPLP
jgi:hypothetical protein